jgi:hypothetical protein
MLARLCLVTLLALSIAACQQSAPPGSSSPSIGQPAASPTSQVPSTKPTPPLAGRDTALAAALLMKVKGHGPMTGYDRAVFGQAWADVDRNGCDTRNDVQTLTKASGGYKTTPAVAAGVDHVWTLTEIAALLDFAGSN